MHCNPNRDEIITTNVLICSLIWHSWANLIQLWSLLFFRMTPIVSTSHFASSLVWRKDGHPPQMGGPCRVRLSSIGTALSLPYSSKLGVHISYNSQINSHMVHGYVFNSLAPGRFEQHFRKVIFMLISVTDGWGISCKIAFRWMPVDLTDDKSTLVQVMAWCRQATSHYQSQCWPRSMLSYGVTRPQWVKWECDKLNFFFFNRNFSI